MEIKQKKPAFTGATPILNVNNVPDSLVYYIEKLGFTLDFAWAEIEGNVPTFAQLKRGKFPLMLCQQGQGSPGTWIYVDLPSLEILADLHREYQASGAKIAEPPTDKPWGMREMLIQDPDGHILRIGSPLPE